MSAPLHRITTLWAGHSVVTVQDEDALVTRAVCYLDRDPLEGRWHIVTLDRVSHAHPYDESGVGYSTRREAAMAYLGGLWVR